MIRIQWKTYGVHLSTMSSTECGLPRLWLSLLAIVGVVLPVETEFCVAHLHRSYTAHRDVLLKKSSHLFPHSQIRKQYQSNCICKKTKPIFEPDLHCCPGHFVFTATRSICEMMMLTCVFQKWRWNGRAGFGILHFIFHSLGKVGWLSHLFFSLGLFSIHLEDKWYLVLTTFFVQNVLYIFKEQYNPLSFNSLREFVSWKHHK